MQLITKVSDLQERINKHRKEGRTIGFTPTLGALHAGHISLVSQMNKKSDISVVSIFVNPTQFNDEADLKKYPRTLEKDQRLLSTTKTNYLFYPSKDQIYPIGLKTKVGINFKGLDRQMEGRFRPGHFAGVVEVVKRLLDIVTPDFLFMGQKDFQQFTIIKHMLKSLKIPTQLCVCDIVREKNGLAMSSRNERLSKVARSKAEIIYKTLSWVKVNYHKYEIVRLKQKAKEMLDADGFDLEYITIANAKTLKSIRKMSLHDSVVVCVAIWIENVRLIDNIILK